jgi:nitrogen fixation protein
MEKRKRIASKEDLHGQMMKRKKWRLQLSNLPEV